MSSDGANLGVTAQRALDTILGGKPLPAKSEEQTREQVLARILAAPRVGGEHPKGYSEAADAIARAIWEANGSAWSDIPDVKRFDAWLGGATGFMVGFAESTVRWLREEPPAQNPALVSVNFVAAEKEGA